MLVLNWRDTRQPRGRRLGALRRERRRPAWPRAATRSPSSAPRTTAHRATRCVDGVRFVRRGGHSTRLPAGAVAPAAAAASAASTSSSTCRTACRSSAGWSPRRRSSSSSTTCTASSGPSSSARCAARIGWWLESRRRPARLPRAAVRRRVARRPARAGRARRRRATGSPWCTTAPSRRSCRRTRAATRRPALCVLGRLVPHKRVELALEALAALRGELPDAAADIVGSRLLAGRSCGREADAPRRRGRRATSPGFVDDATKHESLRQRLGARCARRSRRAGGCARRGRAPTACRPSPTATPAASPSRSPTAGPGCSSTTTWTTSSRRPGGCWTTPALRHRLGAAARERSAEFSWDTTAAAFLTVLRTAVAGRTRHDEDTVEERRGHRGGTAVDGRGPAQPLRRGLSLGQRSP